MLTNTPTAPGQQVMTSLIATGTLMPESVHPAAAMVVCTDAGLLAAEDAFAQINPPTAPAHLIPASASRLFMASGTAATSSPAAGGGGISGVGNGGSDGGRGGKKIGRDLLQTILQERGALSLEQQAAHISFALAESLVTREELKMYLTEHLQEDSLAPLRHRFIPELLTNDEVIDKALKEAGEGMISPLTLARLRRRNLQPSSGETRHRDFIPFELPYENAGPIMRKLMERFAVATEHLPPGPLDRLWHSGRNYRDPYAGERRENKRAHLERETLRPLIVGTMAALDAAHATTFFDAMMDATFSPDIRYPEEATVEWEAEAQGAARAAIIQIGGRQLVDRLETLVDHLFCKDRHSIFPKFGEGDTFKTIGTSLLKTIANGEASPEEVQERMSHIVERAVKMHAERGNRDDRNHGIFTPEYAFKKIAEIGMWAVAPLAETVELLLTQNTTWDLWERMTLTSLMMGLQRSTEHLSYSETAGITPHQSVRRLLDIAFAVIQKIEEIHAPNEYASHLEKSRQKLRETVEGILHTLMDQCPSELGAVLVANPELSDSFNAWREMRMTKPTDK
jgi:hypothetical protein